MPAVVIVGTQWGDEGKGKITDYLAEKAEVVARYQGGNNAGHTIVYQGVRYKLHMIPSGIFYKEKLCILGNGMVINLNALLEEIDYLHNYDVSTENLLISDRAHLIMPYHLKLDGLEERDKGELKIGTTGKGIGPAYMDKAARTGIRVSDLLHPKLFAAKLQRNLEEKNRILERLYQAEPFSFSDIYDSYMAKTEQIRSYITNTSVILNKYIDEQRRVLFEGAQGVMLDIDQGTYPFVTSSNPAAGGVCIGSGVGPTKITQVIGVAKAYTTRVGDGPFPTELHDEIGSMIRETGREYGTTTGRPRRVGWFDSVVLRHAVRVSGITGLSLNSLDVLRGLKSIKICSAYKRNGRIIEDYPACLETLSQCEPVYEEVTGFDEDITGVTDFSQLPIAAQKYLKLISELSGVKIVIFSVGPDRQQTIAVEEIFQG